MTDLPPPGQGTIDAEQGATGREPRLAGFRVRPVLPLVLYGLLAVSAALALWSRRAPDAPPAVAAAAPWVFMGFAAGLAAYRIALVIAGRSSAFRAFVQIGLAATFVLVLRLPTAAERARLADPDAVLVSALSSRDSLPRILAAELVAWRGERALAPRLVALLEDPAPPVRRAAHAALVRLNDGVDLGPGDQPDERGRWRERFP